MHFATAGEIVRKAWDQGYAVPALNANGATYDIARAALEAAQENRITLDPPVI